MAKPAFYLARRTSAVDSTRREGFDSPHLFFFNLLAGIYGVNFQPHFFKTKFLLLVTIFKLTTLLDTLILFSSADGDNTYIKYARSGVQTPATTKKRHPNFLKDFAYEFF
jgi:hypothetical protein